MVTASIVLYKTSLDDLQKVIESYLPTEEKILYLIDNSPEQTSLPQGISGNDSIVYIFSGSNCGYGTGHNIAIRKAIEEKSAYHFVLNPDIAFQHEVIEKIVNFMDSNQDIGLLMPKVLNMDGSVQYVCKLLPSPLNMFLRGFLARTKFTDKINSRFELRDTGYDKLIRVPYISGCFMAFRTSVFKDIGLFDENIFMNMEDCDISRRVATKYKTVMYPEVAIKHRWQRDSHKSKTMFRSTMKSVIYYFNKYGWIFDSERKKINREAEQFNYK